MHARKGWMVQNLYCKSHGRHQRFFAFLISDFKYESLSDKVNIIVS